MDARTQRQVAANEASIRAMNERMVDQTRDFRDDAPTIFTIMCECALETCEEMLDVPTDTYTQVRANPTRFLVAVGHCVPGAERIVEDLGPYLVVEKVGDGADVARERA